ncbi:MAG: PTS sugar transporter subunit IIB [Erysipelotrichaceae bacterium]|nr:PTS sugar transporter subunit IIB [Erysipelotrichaceae bacterium]
MKILLCCGAGMSSGFIAKKVRQAAKADGVADVSCTAQAESTIGPSLPTVDIVCLGPHLRPKYEQIKAQCDQYGAKCMVIPAEIYSTINGEGLYKLIKEELNK